jgi:hypothetical protein
MRQNIAISICLLSLVGLSLGYEQHLMSLSEALIFASVTWQFTGWWLVRQLKVNLNMKITDRAARPATPVAKTMLRGATLLLVASVAACIYTGK